MQFKSKEFKKLKNAWYKELKKTGFEDIEKNEFSVHDWSSKRLIRKNNDGYYTDNRVAYEAREEYYRQATWFLNDYTFEDDVEKQIWEKHSLGESIRSIAAFLKKAGIKTCSTYVNIDIKRLATIMLDMYKAKNE